MNQPATEAPDVTSVVTASRRRPARWWRDPLIGGSTLVLVLFAAAAVLLPLLLPYDVRTQDATQSYGGPSLQHPLGTDELGRDLLVRVLVGIRVDLVVIAVAVPIAMVVGSALGLVSAAYRVIDTPLQRLFDVALAFPTLILGIAVAAVLQAGVTAIVVTVCATSIPVFARVLRAAVRAQAERDYVKAEQALGVGGLRLYALHILPNCSEVVVVQAALTAASAVFIEGALSFLGLGVRPPSPSLGSLLNASLPVLQTSPLYAAAPLVAISVLVLAFTLIADGVNRRTAAR